MHMGINKWQVHPLFRFLLRSRVEWTCWSPQSHFISGKLFELAVLAERANFLKEQITDGSHLFKDAVPSVSSWLWSLPVFWWWKLSLSSVSGHPTRWSCVRGWLMHMLWAYEHDFAAISPLFCKKSGTLCRYPSRSVWLEQRTTGWRSGRSEVYSKSLSAGWFPTDLILLTQRTSPFGSRVISSQQTDQTRALTAGWLVSQSGTQLTTVIFPELHEELTKSWTAPFMARSRLSPSSVLTTLDGRAARGYVDIPQVERAVAVHLCPQNAATWRNHPRHPSKACKLMATFAAKTYSAVGHAASALHAKAILQVHQVKAFKQMHEGSSDLRLMQELRSATDFALWVTKVTARSLRMAISGSTWQRWRTSTKHAFSTLPSPRLGCSAPLSRALPSSSWQCRSRPRRSSTSCPGVMHHQPPLPHRPGLSLLVAVGALLRPPELLRPALNRHLGCRVEPLAGAWHPPCPSQPLSCPGRQRSGPNVGDPEMWESALSQETARTASLLPPEEGRAENLLFCFVFVPPQR